MCPTKDPLREVDGRTYPGDLDEFCGELWIGFTTLGFAQVRHHGIKRALIDRAFDQAKQYFSLPIEWKNQAAITDDFGFGYQDRDKTPLYSNHTNHREIYRFNRDYVKKKRELLPDPNFVPQFEQTLAEMQDTAHNLANKILHCVGDRTGFSEEYFQDLVTSDNVDDALSHLQLEHYYPINAADVARGQAPKYRLRPHTDLSFLTLTFQEENSGAGEVLCGTDEDDEEKNVWIEIPANKDVVIVNAGEMLARWMENGFRATEHHILSSTKHQDQPNRYSLSYFLFPHREAVLESVSQSKFPIRAMEYLERKKKVKTTRTVDDDLVRELLAPPPREDESSGPDMDEDPDKFESDEPQQAGHGHDEL